MGPALKGKGLGEILITGGPIRVLGAVAGRAAATGWAEERQLPETGIKASCFWRPKVSVLCFYKSDDIMTYVVNTVKGNRPWRGDFSGGARQCFLDS